MHIDLLLILLLGFLIPVTVAYKFKNIFVRWAFIIVPPFGLVFLIAIPIDFVAIIFWEAAGILFIISACIIVFSVLRWFIKKLLKRPALIPSLSIRIIRPTMVILFVPAALWIVMLSRKSADVFAIETAKKIQKICDSTGKCPDFITGWEADQRGYCRSITSYGRYGTKYRVYYNIISEDGREFSVWVRHNIDERFVITGGVHKILTAEGKIIPLDIND